MRLSQHLVVEEEEEEEEEEEVVPLCDQTKQINYVCYVN